MRHLGSSSDGWTALGLVDTWCANRECIAGLPIADGYFEPLTRRNILKIAAQVDDQLAVVRPTDCETYSQCTGLPAPLLLDERAGYQGWRLP